MARPANHNGPANNSRPITTARPSPIDQSAISSMASPANSVAPANTGRPTNILEPHGQTSHNKNGRHSTTASLALKKSNRRNVSMTRDNVITWAPEPRRNKYSNYRPPYRGRYHSPSPTRGSGTQGSAYYSERNERSRYTGYSSVPPKGGSGAQGHAYKADRQHRRNYYTSNGHLSASPNRESGAEKHAYKAERQGRQKNRVQFHQNRRRQSGASRPATAYTAQRPRSSSSTSPNRGNGAQGHVYQAPRQYTQNSKNWKNGGTRSFSNHSRSKSRNCLTTEQLRDIIAPLFDEYAKKHIPNESGTHSTNMIDNDRPDSDNSEFGQQVSRVDKAIRLEHASQFWNPIPVSIDRALNRCRDNIKPPCFDETYASEITRIFQTLKDSLCNITRCHIFKHFQTKMEDLFAGNTTDLDRIKTTAAASAKRRTRITEETINMVFEKLDSFATTPPNSGAATKFPPLRGASPPSEIHSTGPKQGPPTRPPQGGKTPPNNGKQTALHQGPRKSYSDITPNRSPPTSEEDPTVEPQGEQHTTTDGFKAPKKSAKSPPKSAQDGPISTTNKFNPLAGADEDDHITVSQLMDILELPMDSQEDTSMVPPTQLATPKRKRRSSPETVTYAKTFVADQNRPNTNLHTAAHQGPNGPTRVTTMATPPLHSLRATAQVHNEPTQTGHACASMAEQPMHRTDDTIAIPPSPGQPTIHIQEEDVICTGHTPAAMAQQPMHPTDDSTTAARTRSMSAANVHTTHTNETVCYSSKQKKEWVIKEIPAYKKIAIIGDSNAQSWLDCSTLWSVHAFSGAHLHHLIDILEKSKFPPNIKMVVIAVGVNDRETTPSHLMDQLHKILDLVQQKHGLPSRFLMVPQLPTFTGQESAIIRQLNRTARDIWGKGFIPCPMAKEIQARNATDHAHYTLGTAAKICDRLRKNIPTDF